MAPFKIASLIGKGGKKHAPVLVSSDDNNTPRSDVETGSFLHEAERNNRVVIGGQRNDGDNPYLDEYRA
jgi:H+-transporting ATPase